ncbi:alpha/beta hydrolase [Paracoccaceae bacterium Fryx2]|nr:alpha/beta hydrolase [Paracoccaceae bacterium Fryx2]
MTEPLLMIPGLMADARQFLPQILALSPRRPVMLALPTCGATVEDMAQAILAAAPPRFALAGLGLGGDVALEMIRRAPDRVTRVALISTDPLSETPQTAAARESRMVAARSGRLSQAMAEEVPLAALAPGPGRARVLALVADMAAGFDPGVFVVQSRAMQRRPDQQKTLRRALLPALVIAGAQDTPQMQRRQDFVVGLMPYARLLLIEGADMMAPLEQPEAVSEALETFLNRPLLLR